MSAPAAATLPHPVGAAAAHKRLGAHVRVYHPARMPARAKRVLGTTMAIALVVAAVGGAVSAIASGLRIFLVGFGVILAVMAAARLLRSQYYARRNAGLQLHFFQQGLVIVGMGGRIYAFRFDTVSVLQNIVRHYRNGALVRITYAYTLTDPDGTTMTLGGGFEKPTEWGPAIQDAVTRAQLPAALGALQAGRPLAFGDITVAPTHVAARGKSVPWSHIQEVKVDKGYITLRVAGRWRALTNTAVRGIPNVFVFLEVADRVRTAATRRR